MKKRVAILGYGQLGEYLVDKILTDPTTSQLFELEFVWNRTKSKLDVLEPRYRFVSDNLLEDFNQYVEDHSAPDLIIEASHSDIIKKYGHGLLKHSDLFITTLSALADPECQSALLDTPSSHSIFIPNGAAWGVNDIVKLDESGNLKQIKISMNFTYDALRLNSPLKEVLDAYINDDTQLDSKLLYSGKVRQLAPMAPNNVNTMCCIALAATSLGFDNIDCSLSAHKGEDAHIIEIECYGCNGFYVKTTRINPSNKGAVTGSQTFDSFHSSLKRAKSNSIGIHFC